MVKVFEAILTVIGGVLGAYAVYFILNKAAELLPGRWEDRVKPYFYVLPAIAIVAVIVLYPTIQTINYSFANAGSTAYVGLSNYSDLLGSSDFRNTLFNTLLWIIIAPAATIALGLVVATLADRLNARSEKLSKTIIFLPMAIGGVGAATIWKFIYLYSTPGSPQIGLQNAIWTGPLGRSPVDWLSTQNLHFNTIELIIIMLWGQIGYSMVLLSAAIKGVPGDTVEAARIDGANELQIFRRILVPQIVPTIITVFITVLIGTMKIFDIIYVMTGGQYNTSVIGVQFYNELFTNQNTGHAAAIVVMLMIAVIPVMIYQVRHFRAQEANR